MLIPTHFGLVSKLLPFPCSILCCQCYSVKQVESSYFLKSIVLREVVNEIYYQFGEMEEGFKDMKIVTNKSVFPSGLLSLKSRWYLSISDAGAKDPQFRQTVHHGAEWRPAAQRRVSISMFYICFLLKSPTRPLL